MSHNNGRYEPLRGEDGEYPPIVPSGYPAYPSYHRSRPSAPRQDFSRIIAALREHIGMVVLITVAALGATAFMIGREHRQYVATATVQLADARRQLTSGIEQRDETPERATSPLLSQIQVLESRSLIGRVADTVGHRLVLPPSMLASGVVRNVHVDTAAAPDTIRVRFTADGIIARSRSGRARGKYDRPVTLGAVTFTVTERPSDDEAIWIVTSREEAVDAILASLRVTPRASTNVVDVAYTATSPAAAQQVVNAVVQSFRKQSANSAQQQSRLRRRFLEQQLRRIDSLQTDARQELASFRQRTLSFSSIDRLSAQQREVTELEMLREQLRAEREMYVPLRSYLADAETGDWLGGVRSAIGSVPGGEDPVIHSLFDRISAYQASRDSLTTGTWRRSATDPDVQRLDNLIGAARNQLGAAIEGRITAYDGQLTSLDNRRARRTAALASVAELETEEERLEQRVATIERMEMTLRDEAQKARAAEAVEIGEVEIVDLASLPYAPKSNLAAVKLGLGLVFGLGLGGGLAIVREWRNTTIRNREELEELLHIPSLGAIPSLAGVGLGSGAARLWDDTRRRLRGDVAGNALNPRLQPNRELAALDSNPSQQAEAYRVLSTNLLSVPKDARPTSFVVTSAGVSEGKTTVAANLAVTLARAGRRVLLIDCDLRRARLHHVFEIPRSPGLVQALDDMSRVDHDGYPEYARASIHLTSTPGLDLMPRGAGEVDENMLIGGEAMPRLLRHLQERYDVVVLDAPPVLAMAYTLQLAGLADGVLFVARAGKTQRPAVRETVRRLRNARARVAGCVLTDADPEHGFHQYYAPYSAAMSPA